MDLNKNILCATNPARISDALWQVINTSGVDLSDILIFLPSRRAVRVVEKMLVKKSGHSVILPRLVALGEGTDDEFQEDDINDVNNATIGDMERVIAIAQLLRTAGNVVGVNNMDTALSVAHDLVRMTDYLENEGVDIASIDWDKFVDEKYATHFQAKAQILNIISQFLPQYCAGRITKTMARNAGIRDWIRAVHNYKLVIVCASTASVPATADLMAVVATIPHGRIILPGKIAGRVGDLELATNPYNSEYRFLTRVGACITDVIPIDVGPSAIDFFNCAFGNDFTVRGDASAVSHCHLVTCGRESIEADVAAEIAAKSVADKKSVLIITPDAAGNQRLANALQARGLVADFSGGMPGNMTGVGRAILNMFDRWIESGATTFEELYVKNNRNLLNTIIAVVDDDSVVFTPTFDVLDSQAGQIWNAIAELSDILNQLNFVIDVRDARALLADVIGACSVRGTMNDTADVVVLGTIESRMQTADVVILSGLNEGMFPATGYDNNWLPRRVATEIGLPSPDRKVSLMALDFMNLSCGREVYWLRCVVSGGAEKIESRFLSRVAVAGGVFNSDIQTEVLPYDTKVGQDIVQTVLACDVVPLKPLDYSAPTPPADWSDVYVTKLEYLIHNPYAFYVNHILGLTPKDDYWEFPSAAKFGTLVHDTIERCMADSDVTAEKLISALDIGAHDILGGNNILFDFWHHRFIEFANVVVDELKKYPDIRFECSGHVDVYLDAEKQSKRTVRARADGVWSGGVLDIKTGKIPTDAQLISGTMPQLPIEALMLETGGFGNVFGRVKNPKMKFLHLARKNPHVADVERMANAGKDNAPVDVVRAAHDKIVELFRTYSAGNAPYEYRDTPDSDIKSHIYDDFARVGD